jgi:hypothetical protein
MVSEDVANRPDEFRRRLRHQTVEPFANSVIKRSLAADVVELASQQSVSAESPHPLRDLGQCLTAVFLGIERHFEDRLGPRLASAEAAVDLPPSPVRQDAPDDPYPRGVPGDLGDGPAAGEGIAEGFRLDQQHRLLVELQRVVHGLPVRRRVFEFDRIRVADVPAECLEDRVDENRARGRFFQGAAAQPLQLGLQVPQGVN